MTGTLPETPAFPIERCAGRWREEVPAGRWGAALWPAGAAFAAVAGLRSWAYDEGWLARHDLGVPVVSVGNLTAGGTGKTPAVAAVVARLQALGRRPAVLARGYRGGADGRNEEASLVGEVPVVCDPDRVAGGRRAIAAGADALVLDDGFQHRRLRRDLDIVLIDATRPWGRDDGGPGRPLPAGYLREPPTHAARAGLLWLTRTDLVPAGRLQELRATCARLAPGAPVVEERLAEAWLQPLDGGPRVPAAAWSGRPVILASGIGHPAAFERQAQVLGLRVVRSLRFPDHHHFTAAEVQRLDTLRQSTGATLVVTAKDAVKLAVLPGTAGIQVLGVRSALVEGKPLDQALARLVDPARKMTGPRSGE